MTKQTTSTVDVLIVGGGPTGVTLGLELAAQGVSFRIVDRAGGRSDKSRALVVQPRTLELLHRYRYGGRGGSGGDSIARALQARGNTADGSTICVSGRRVASFDVRDVGRLPNTAFPFQLLVSQEDTERLLDESLAEAAGGYGVEWETEARDIAEDDGGVTITLKKPGGEETETETETETVRAKFAVGCDGKNSAVRAAAGLKFEGDSYAQDFVLADARVAWKDPGVRNNRAYLCFGHGLLTVLPLSVNGDRVRVVAIRASVTDKQSEAPPPLADFQKHFDREMPPELAGTLHDVAWLARFYLHHRGADRYGSGGGRLFVAGDAAHVHSPVGGQGMNTGMQDAANLGWKLGAVARGERPPALLDSYHAERHPVGRELLRTTDRAFTWMSWMNPVFLFLRNLLLPWVLPLALRDPERLRGQFRGMSGLAITYRDSGSGIVGTAPGLGPGASKIRGGDRVLDGKVRGPGGEKYLLELLDAKTHHLVLFSGSDAAAAAAASEGELQRAGDKFAEKSHVVVKVHAVFAQKPNGQSGYVDVDGILHRELGFQKGAAYILVRPDGYAAHVGPLSALDDLITWFNGPSE